MAHLQLNIVTPECVLLSKQVDYVSATGVEGEFGVLPQHMPLLAALACGKLGYREKGEMHYVSVCGGFAEVLDNKVTILADAAELASGIDVDRAIMAKERAEDRLSNKADKLDAARAQAALSRAVTRLHVASMR